MSAAEGFAPVAPDDEAKATNSQTLEERMRVRRDEVENLTSEKFPLPRYESVAAVELRYLGYERQRALFDRNRRQRNGAIRELYTACDQILSATLSFYELRDADDVDGAPTDHTWLTLAKRVLSDQLRDDATPRQAMIALLKPEAIVALYNEWQEWMGGQRESVNREVELDFPMTG